MATLIKSALKFGIVGGAIYWTSQQGVWDDSIHSVKVMETVVTKTCPYTKEFTDKIEFPHADSISSNMRCYWNLGVQKSFSAIAASPAWISERVSTGINYVKENFK